MASQRNWSMEQRMRMLIYAPVIAFAAVAGAIGLLTLAQSQARSAPHPEAAVLTPLQRSEDARREEFRQSYQECMKNMGGSYSRSRFGSRFSRPPDMNKLRQANSVCRSLLGGGTSRLPAPRPTSSPPVI